MFCANTLLSKAVKYNVWCSTRFGNTKLNDAFVTANGQYPIFLLFSVNSSGHFVGVAQMKSAVKAIRVIFCFKNYRSTLKRISQAGTKAINGKVASKSAGCISRTCPTESCVT